MSALSIYVTGLYNRSTSQELLLEAEVDFANSTEAASICGFISVGVCVDADSELVS